MNGNASPNPSKPLKKKTPGKSLKNPYDSFDRKVILETFYDEWKLRPHPR